MMRFVKALLLAGSLATAGTTAAQSKNCFTIGSSHSFIRNLHGVPTSIYKNQDGTEVWVYGKSSITFKDYHVSEYDNYGKNLKICKEVVPVMDAATKKRLGYLSPEQSKSKATQKETEDWILSKLAALTPKNIHIDGYFSVASQTQYPGKDIKDITFTFETGKLVVRCRIEDGQHSHNESYSIPVHDLKRIHADLGKLVFTTKNQSIVHTAGKESRRETTYATKFDFSAEEDIKDRMVQAFSHLQKYYKPAKSKETF